MGTITIDGKTVEFREGATVLEAARGAGIGVPSLCSRPGLEPGSSCMVCLVKDLDSSRLLPSCAALAAVGLRLDASSPEVLEARRTALGLLLSEHAGDCEAPCERSCPAGLDVQAMLGELAAGNPPGALAVAREALAFPGISSRLCRAPCQKACRRSLADSAVSILDMEGYAFEAGGAPGAAPGAEAGGRKVLVAGAGLAGLAAAYHLAKAGARCRVVETGPRPFPALATGSGARTVPPEVLASELETLRSLSVEIEVCSDFSPGDVEDAVRRHDVFVAASGGPGPGSLHESAKALKTGAASADLGARIVLCGEAEETPENAVRALAAGKKAADEALRALGLARPEKPLFASRAGRVEAFEIAGLKKEANPAARVLPGPGDHPTRETAAAEANRCLECGCRKARACALRDLAGSFGLSGQRRGDGRRRPIERDSSHPLVVYESGKCLLCGLCVKLCERAGEPVGLGFQGRGFDCKVAPPPGKTLSEALTICAKECAEACPTGALSLKT